MESAMDGQFSDLMAEIGAKARAAASERGAFDQRFLLGECAVDAIDLLFEQHIGAIAFDGREARVIRRLEVLERAHQRVRRAGGRSLGFFLHVVLLKRRG